MGSLLDLMQTNWTKIEHKWIGSPLKTILVTVDRGRQMFCVYYICMFFSGFFGGGGVFCGCSYQDESTALPVKGF